MAAGETDGPLAKDYGYQSQQVAIHRLKHMPTSPARMSGAALAAYNQTLQAFAVASKANRLERLQAIFDRIESLIEARAADATSRAAKVRQLEEAGEQVPEGLAPLPGATSGLLGPDGKLDTYAIREYRSTLEQVAKECGEWDITGSGGREDAAAGAAQVTIQQVIHGSSHMAVAADPRPGSASIQAAHRPLSLPSMQSVRVAEGEGATGAVLADGAGGEGAGDDGGG